MSIRNKNRKGYKHTSIGWIPEEWENKKLKNISVINPDSLSESTNPDFKFYYLDLGVAKNGGIDLPLEKLHFLGSPSRARRRIKKNDILVSTVRPNLKGFAFIDFDADNYICSTGFAVVRAAEDCDPKYIHYNLFTNKMESYFSQCVIGSSYPALNNNDVENIPIPLPPLPEQKKIAKILSAWDKAIELTQNLIVEKQRLKKGLMQKLLTGRVRFSEFGKNSLNKNLKLTNLGVPIPQGWEKIQINDVLSERIEVSSDLRSYPLFSLTIEKGVTEKTERYERSFLLKDKEQNDYRIVYPNDIIYNPMNLRFGAIAVSNQTKIVSVSAYYNVLTLKTKKAEMDFLIRLFISDRMMNVYDRVAIGSLIEKKRVHLSDFLEIEIPLPSLPEQKKIAAVLSKLDEQISLLRKKESALKEQKKGLMQKLLTGEVRV